MSWGQAFSQKSCFRCWLVCGVGMCVPVNMCLWADAVCLVICRSLRFTSALILYHSLFLFIDTRSLSCTHSSSGLHSERWNYRQALMPVWALHKFWVLKLILMVVQEVLKTTNRVLSLSVILIWSHKCVAVISLPFQFFSFLREGFISLRLALIPVFW